MNEEFIMFDPTSGCMFNSNLEKLKMAQEEVNKCLQEESKVSFGDSIENLEEETQYQLWKRSIEVFGEELGASWVIDGDIFYRSAFDKYIGIGANLRDVFFKGKKLEL